MQFGISLIHVIEAKENCRSRYRNLHKTKKFMESNCLRVHRVIKKCVLNLVLLFSIFIAANSLFETVVCYQLSNRFKRLI